MNKLFGRSPKALEAYKKVQDEAVFTNHIDNNVAKVVLSFRSVSFYSKAQQVDGRVAA